LFSYILTDLESGRSRMNRQKLYKSYRSIIK